MTIAKLGKECRKIVMENTDTIKSKSIGAYIVKIRRLLSSEMEQINNLVKEIISVSV
jgi:hypothetical protein